MTWLVFDGTMQCMSRVAISERLPTILPQIAAKDLICLQAGIFYYVSSDFHEDFH